MDSGRRPDINQRIVITGVGPVTRLGSGKEPTWAALREKAKPFSVISESIGGEPWDSYPLAEAVEFDPASVGIRAQQLDALSQAQKDRDLILFSAAAKLALQDSRFQYDHQDNRVGMVMAHENPGFDEYTRRIWEAMETIPAAGTGALSPYIKALYQQVERAGYNTHSFVLLQQLTVILATHGPALCINNACSSGLYALESAAGWLRAGHADAMVVVCGDSPRLITRYLWLKAAKNCARDGVIRPFDKNRTGFALGEGAGAVVIETLDSAKRRGATIYTEYLGGAFKSDAWKLTLPAVSPHLYYEAIQEALSSSGKTPSQIDLVVPHGSATPIQDQYEADGITRVFGKHSKRTLVTALKPYVGHTLAGSSLIEIILTLIGLCHETILPTLNWTTPDDRLGLEPVQHPTPYKVANWIKTATGFGGFNAACVFAQPELASL